MSKLSLGVQKVAPKARPPLGLVVVGTPSPLDYATIANAEHELARQSGESMLAHAFRAGEALLGAKAQIKHGDWLPWLAANFQGSERSAQAYMKVAANPQSSADLEEPSIAKALAAIGGTDMAHVGQNSGENEWFTPAPYIQAAVRVMGGIDLDPASNPIANEVVGAETFYTAEDSGLDHGWHGRVWMNPPYAQPLIWHFSEKLAEEVAQGNVTEACALVNNATETAFFQRMAEVAKAICFPTGRVKFWHPERESATPLQGQAVIYFGENVKAFCTEFGAFGFTAAIVG